MNFRARRMWGSIVTPSMVKLEDYMNFLETITSKESSSLRRLGRVIFLAGVLSLTGCGITDEKATITAAPTQLPLPSDSTEYLKIVFDALEGPGSSIIQVYPGVGDVASDKVANGTFNDGDLVEAICKTRGRVVSSSESRGEEKRVSDEWVKIVGTPGLEQFATSVYIENPSVVLKKLPNC